MTITVISPANVGISIALKVILTHLQAIKWRGIPNSIFQEKGVLWSGKYGISSINSELLYLEKGLHKSDDVWWI
jgi:hypothetical protein